MEFNFTSKAMTFTEESQETKEENLKEHKYANRMYKNRTLHAQVAVSNDWPCLFSTHGQCNLCSVPPGLVYARNKC